MYKVSFIISQIKIVKFKSFFNNLVCIQRLKIWLIQNAKRKAQVKVKTTENLTFLKDINYFQ
jgi:hypothetical protein